jgi:hypothetical protein
MTTTTNLSSVPAFACNLSAISAGDRPRYLELIKRVRAGIKARNEVQKGYEFILDSTVINLAQIAEWISMERLCCPFLTLQVYVFGNDPDCKLTLTGPEGVKPLLHAEFPAC